MPQIPWTVHKTDHPGSTLEEIQREPDWSAGHGHRVGFKNKVGRKSGLTHFSDEQFEEDNVEAIEDFRKLRAREERGDLVNFRDVVKNQKDYHLRSRDNVSAGWRYVLDATEDDIKNSKEWPANIKQRQKEDEAKKKQDEEKAQQQKPDGKKAKRGTNGNDVTGSEEHDWKRSQGDKSKHHNAYATKGDTTGSESDNDASGSSNGSNDDSSGTEDTSDDEDHKSAYEKLLDKYTPHEIALLRTLQHEENYVRNLQENDGKGKSPQHHNISTISIDEQDQFSPDNWLPRSSDLIRLTGKHPMNAEANLSHLYDAGLITPNELHYVRNHGAVPRILWEFHKIDVEHGKLVLTMEELKTKFAAVNIAVALACDGNRRKELNMIRRSKGFNWGAGAVSCAYWKGPLLRDVLLAAGVPEKMPSGRRYWVNFEGADKPSEGKYQTCIPFQYAMDATNDVMLAYEMNDQPLPPDHGYPCRLMIPGYVGGRCVKWLHRIWVSDKENDSHYHIWDNRVLPSFVTEKDGAFADAMFRHPDTACNEQNLNSVIVKPAHGEKIALSHARKGKTYRIEGYAYDGGGHEVQRVEVSLDDGETWLYCIRKFPDRPIRHGNKFWTWLHWHVDVGITHLLRAKNVTVRCFNVFKNTQPREPSWNTMGMMNNCWYVVEPEIVVDEDDPTAKIHFRHPVEPGTGDGGWMKPSVENQIDAAKQAAGTPQKQFTREEIEKHDNDGDCWLVIDGKVYDATSVLSWHPGGSAAIVGHAGKVHQETSDEFASIHDGYAYKKLKDCILGVVTEKTANFIKKNAEAAAKEKANAQDDNPKLALQKHRWVPVKLQKRESLSKDTRAYTFELPKGQPILGLGATQHIQIGFHMKDKMLVRSYTPTKPLLPAADGKTDSKDGVRDGCGTFELTVKTYFPDENQPGGAMSNILDCIPIGEEVEIRGPTGEIVYLGNGKFDIEGAEQTFKRVSLVLGGSGITPGYSLIARVVLTEGDKTEIRVVDANKSEGDILLREALTELEKKADGRLKITHVLSHPGDEWKGLTGHVNEEIIKKSLFEPGKDSAVFLCGPPAMIQKAALPALTDWGYEEEKNVWGF